MSRFARVFCFLLLLVPPLSRGLAATQAVPPPRPAAGTVDFVRDIQPIFAKSCAGCHGAVNQKSGLRLDSGEAALRGGNSGADVVPGDSTHSRLVTLVSGGEGSLVMPPGGPRLTAEQVRLIRAWIDQGARLSTKGQIPARRRGAGHWAFQPLRRPALPVVKNSAWVRNPTDRFVLARLEREKLAPAPQADRVTLIRRLSLDLLGLPPSPAEVLAFLDDRRPDAYERLVDRLLASPHYGEHWGRWWLDAARYADTNGYEKDNQRSIWLYRDWVIDALNRDMPFDQFTIEQIAGDMLPNATRQQKIATGFHRNTMINQEGGVDQEQFRVEALVDRVGTTGTVFLGLTIGCARCHDHKYDPISQREFYQLFAFLNNADEPDLEIATPEELKKRDAIRAQITDSEADLKRYLTGKAPELPALEKGLTEEARKKLKPEILEILAVAPNARDEKQKQALVDALTVEDAGRKEREAKIAALKKSEPTITSTMVMSERVQPRVTTIFVRGDFLKKGDVVYPAVPTVVRPLLPTANRDRLTLARWLVDPRNPLTARVTMNRVWQSYFGRGLVATTEDFGTRGEKPSHPELLDWLATEFMRQGWSLKAMHRLIVQSATYRQSSHASPALYARDPYNMLLARGARYRLPAEGIRDVALSASGLLNPASGGPSVFPPQPDGVTSLSYGPLAWKTETGPNRYRRALYTFFKRTSPYPALITFDAPNADTTCVRRVRSNTPLQALTTLNDAVFVEVAQALAWRVMAECAGDTAARVRHAFRLCLAREPDSTETRRLVALFEQQRARFAGAGDRATVLIGIADGKKPGTAQARADVAERAAWTVVARVLLNLDETITRE
jgi:mono/diheme cytochrome c family protein